MLEWLKRHAWKACKRQKCFRGSNPRLSAKDFAEAKDLHRMPPAGCGLLGAERRKNPLSSRENTNKHK